MKILNCKTGIVNDSDRDKSRPYGKHAAFTILTGETHAPTELSNISSVFCP